MSLFQRRSQSRVTRSAAAWALIQGVDLSSPSASRAEAERTSGVRVVTDLKCGTLLMIKDYENRLCYVVER